jgi:4'-phosphopantetheinyl transferase EntD
MVGARLVAKHLLEHLKLSNYVIMKGPARKPYSTPTGKTPAGY